MKTSIRNWLVVVTTMILTCVTSFAANFTKGNIVVLRSGDGSTALGTAATPIAVLEVKTNDGSVVQTVSVPTSGASALTGVGNSSTEGMMTLAPNNHLLALPGYNVDAATAAPNSLSVSAGRRSVGTIDQSGNFVVAITATAGLTGNNRAATTDGAGNFWEGLSTGVQYVATPATLGTPNSRAVDIRNGNLYYVTAGGVHGINKYAGLPTSTATPTQIIADGGTPNDFAIDDAETTIYMADANTWSTSAQGVASGGIRKYTWNGSAWVHQYTIRPDSLATTGAASLAADFSGANPVIYCVSGTAANNEVTVVIDTGASSAGTTLTLAGANFAFRSLRFAPYGAPAIATQPQPQTVNEGVDATFSVTLADGTSTTSLTYVWKDNLGATLATHSSASLSDSFTFSNPQLADNGKNIHVEITDDLGTVASAEALLTVNSTGQPPAINFDVTADKDPIYAGQTVNLEVDVTGTTPMTYSWFKDGSPLTTGGNVTITSSGLSSIVTISGITVPDAGTYYVGITNANGGTNSSLAIAVSVPAAPVITAINPQGNITNNAAATRNITVGASDDSGVLTYQWKRDTSNLTDGSQVNAATVAGANTAALTLIGVLGGDDGVYHCVVSNAGGSSDSSDATINTLPGNATLFVVDPIVTAQPASHIVREGNSIIVSVTATGTGMTYAWSKDGNPLSDGGNVTGSSTPSLTVSSATASDAGNYTVAVTGTYGSLSTTPATIQVATTSPTPLAATNIVVLQRGDGVEALAASGNSLYINQYDPNGNLVSSFGVPNSGGSSILQAGNTPTEGWLTKSADGQQLVFAGYTVAYGNSTALSGSSSSTINRAVGTFDKNGNYTLAAYGTNHNTGNIRSATGDGLGNFWTAGSKDGIELFPSGGVNGNANGMQVWTRATNLRVINIFNGNLYQGSSTVYKTDGADPTSGADGVYGFSGLPTTLQTTPNTNEWYITIHTNAADVGIYDFAISPDDSIAYITDDQGFSAPDIGGLHRYDKVGGVWTYSYRIAQATRGLTVDWSGANPTIYATTPSHGTTNGNNFVNAGNDLVKVVDTGAESTVTTIATAVGGAFAGVRIAPGTLQTITFGGISGKVVGDADFNLNASSDSSLPITYTVISGPATITGSTVHLTGAGDVNIRASQSGDGTYSPATSVVQGFTVYPVPTLTAPADLTVDCDSEIPVTDFAGGTYTGTCSSPTVTWDNDVTNGVSPKVITRTYRLHQNCGDSDVTATQTITVTEAPPVITVDGNPVVACMNSVYNDAGISASSACNVGSITTTGIVDTATVGSYTLTYSATDANGITSTATRVVNVVDCDTAIAITGQPQNQLKQPQGTNVLLSVMASGSPLTYQWYENNVLIPGATGATNSFVAHTNAITGTNLTYYVVVSNSVTVVQSSSALVTVLVDKTKPTLVVTAPLNNTRAQSFTVKGKTTDTHGNDAKLKYFWTGITTPGTSPTYSIDISGVGADPTKRDFTGSGFALTNPPSAGTNTLTIWVEDLAGNASSPAKVVKVFWQVPHTYALTISGDGTGSVKVSTKGAPQEVVAGAPTGTLVGSANTVYNMSLYAHQVYSIKYTPDPKLDHPTAGTSIASVVSNAVPVELAGTTTTRAQTVTFTAGDTDTSANVSFARNRFVDMAGTYNGVFTGLTNVASSRLFVMTISPTRTVSGYLMDATKTKTTFTAHQTLNADGSGTIVAGGITISGSLAWTGSEDPNGVKEFIGSATDGSWTAALTAEKADKTALPTEGFATMQIPGGFGGSGFATVHSKNGTITAIYTLADDDKHAVSFAMMGNRSKNIPQWITSTHSGGLLFGNLIVDDGLTNLSAPALSWIRPSGNLFYPALLPAGFTNSPFAAVCSPFLAGSKLNGTYTLNITGGGLANDITSQTVTFTDSKMTAAGKVKVGLMDPFGKLKFTFQDGTTPTHTTIAVGALLQNATNGVGFFIKPLGTDAGNVSLTPQ